MQVSSSSGSILQAISNFLQPRPPVSETAGEGVPKQRALTAPRIPETFEPPPADTPIRRGMLVNILT